MWRRFWIQTDFQGDDELAYAPDVLLANWIPPPQQQPAAVREKPVQVVTESEAGDFMLRVYAYQQS